MKPSKDELVSGVQQAKPTGYGKAFGSFGELLQGRLCEEDSDFLVTLPIDAYSYATYSPRSDLTTVIVMPAWKQKSSTLAKMILQQYDLPPGGILYLESDIPVGKGLSSSSSDLVATARALADCFGLQINHEELFAFMRAIEPSDGVMYNGIVSFYHRKVQLHQFHGSLPALTILGLSEEGCIDTIQFNKRPKPFTQKHKQNYQRLLNTLTIAIQQQDLRTIGIVATQSALLNQKLNPKNTLDQMIELCKQIDGLGVVVAHSGTCVGILLSSRDAMYEQKKTAGHAQLAQWTQQIVEYKSLCF